MAQRHDATDEAGMGACGVWQNRYEDLIAGVCGGRVGKMQGSVGRDGGGGREAASLGTETRRDRRGGDGRVRDLVEPCAIVLWTPTLRY